ncbi:hypothetical protein ACF3DV_04855 [Chlorogloeopsis fritschii PCC 9212]|uniref:Uncharacterized protein n=1 Tax=Chlorogloeopsis fritschii PCC 6912 TaxID=211165 RepID=A0A3S0XLF5_CHLFR|nr:hypothetical protein [Chlorogloeopsis fritschii]MBF2008674.1 hypothetical protein [Chlorogloeopsis fritschii C42_A2020_084]RUR72724.1 hypothetical protein PCC6912_60990 [Chlorogloeopsis fritschii PCC 6912]
MQITIDLPDKLTEKIQDKWGNLPQKILANLVLDAFRDGLIDFDELKDMLNFFSDAELKEFLKQKNMLHSAGILNFYGACPDLDIVEDDLGISDDMDDDLIGVFDE